MARRFREQLARVRFRPLLAAIGNEMVTSVSRRFETGTAPDGSRWPESLRARLTGGQTLMAACGFHRRDRAAAHCPQCGSGHQRGLYVHPPVRRHHPPHIIRARRARALEASGIGFRRAVHHPGGTIPARPYLGLSDAD